MSLAHAQFSHIRVFLMFMRVYELIMKHSIERAVSTFVHQSLTHEIAKFINFHIIQNRLRASPDILRGHGQRNS